MGKTDCTNYYRCWNCSLGQERKTTLQTRRDATVEDNTLEGGTAVRSSRRGLNNAALPGYTVFENI